ncbi:helicase-associated domain-containing protein [Streptomyces sp. H27-D2]|uniref:helicase-associated domain-containing protein n=1 Tax=Streptomyces sp. H27-D2 TaxID=3046304 RepID=UPI002DBCDED4|nr:helicase-associated domain-containing protein [Streptomyces sp. H27-D2]MEC4020532.1 helicase-associated domain-containing protein [Streptomyces sp. H27-D2]
MTTERNREARVPAKTGPGDRTATAPRTLAEELRTRPDDSLAALLHARPELLSPVPGDLTQLATRAGTRASVVRALERLDRFVLQTAEALAVAPEPCPYGTLRALLSGDEPDERVAAELPRAIAVLRTQALIWGTDERLRLVRTARELLAPTATNLSPTGLGPTTAEATTGMSPGRLQEILTSAGLPPTHDPVTAVTSLTTLFGDRERMAALLAGAPPESTAVLGKLVWGPPYGTVPPAPAPPVQWLLARGLLLPAASGNVVLPREAALHLRGGRAHRAIEPLAPALEPVTERGQQLVDEAAAGQAFTALAAVDELLKEWDNGGPAVLRAGGMSVRDLKRTGAALDVSESVAAFWIELAYAAGLLASDGATEERYAPTPGYDEWARLPAEQRWAQLVTAWLVATRTAGLVGTRDGKGRTLAVLGPDLDRSPAPEVRRRTLELLAGMTPGASVPTDAVLARLRWERPPRGGSPAGPTAGAGAATAATAAAQGPDDLRTRLARWTLAETEMLGVTGRGALSSQGRALLGPNDQGGSHNSPHTSSHTDEQPSAAPRTRTTRTTPTAPTAPTPRARTGFHTGVDIAAAAAHAAEILVPLLPKPLNHVLLQADLTAVAPGPLERPLAEMLGVLADVESKGGATVYRFTPQSVRRALDVGRTATDLQAFLTEHSRTPVPQPLAYLIDDVARKHGRLRIGAASAYLRCDDDALLSELLVDRRSAGFGLRRLAPTVLAAQAAPETLLDGLRAMGYAPAAESAEGDVLITRPDAHRTPPRTAPSPVPDGPPQPDDTLLTAAVRAIRAGDLAATATHKPAGAPTGSGAGAGIDGGTGSGRSAAVPTPTGDRLPRTTSAETLATMQAAALTGSVVWMGYVNADGAASQRVIAPVRVEGGFVTAYDHTADEVRTYPLHRVTGVAELADE